MKKINIAIDGFSGCGKSTLAKQLAQALNYVFVDTGAMYRALTFLVLAEDSNKDSIPLVLNSRPRIEFNEFNEVLINGHNREKEIRGDAVANKVSEVASDERIREYLMELQTQWIDNKGVVMEGRDIASVIMPNADLKLFITADVQTRVERRFLQLGGKANGANREDVEENLSNRDLNDINRDIAPLKLVSDAIVVDTTNLSAQEQLKLSLSLASPKIDPKGLLGMLKSK